MPIELLKGMFQEEGRLPFECTMRTLWAGMRTDTSLSCPDQGAGAQSWGAPGCLVAPQVAFVDGTTTLSGGQVCSVLQGGKAHLLMLHCKQTNLPVHPPLVFFRQSPGMGQGIISDLWPPGLPWDTQGPLQAGPPLPTSASKQLPPIRGVQSSPGTISLDPDLEEEEEEKEAQRRTG